MKLYMFIQMLLLLFCFVGNIRCSTVPDNSTDVVALLEFKQAITNRPAEALSNWNRSTNICQWQGVTCNPKNHGRVTALNLAGLGLSGAITASVGNLTFLHTLNLSRNRLSGQIPPLGNLYKLQVLDLSTNSLEGNIPDTITNCSSLRKLWLFANSLVGIIPPEIGHLYNLENFDLHVNNLNGIIPSSIHNITGLTLLNLGTNQLSGIIPDVLGRNLEYLGLKSNLLDGAIPDTLTNCSHLILLDLSRNNLRGIIPPGIGSLTNLQEFSFRRNGLSGGIPVGFSNITTLFGIDLSENQLNGLIPGKFWHLPNIKLLYLNENNLSGGIPQNLSNLSNLKELSLAVNKLGKTLPSNIGHALSSINTLYLGMNMFEGPIPASLGNASSLTELDLSDNKFSGQIPSMFEKLSGLSVLNLDSNIFEASESAGWEFFEGLTNCRSLEVLSLSNNRLHGFIPNSVANLSTNLIKLVMGGNYLSGIVPSSIGNLNSLIELALDNNNLTGTIEEWIGKLTKLQSLYLQENSLTGTIPPSISNLVRLTTLSFAENEFTGLIPPSLGNLKPMLILNLSYNNFQGSIPVEFGNFKQLTTLDLSFNRFTGEIPETMGQFEQIYTIQLDENILTGNIPITFSNLKSLSILSLSHNNLSGSIPVYLNDLKSLTKLDLSYNNFQGEIPENGVFDNATIVSLDGNLGLCGGATNLHMPSCHVVYRREEEIINYMVKILVPVFGSILLILFIYNRIHEKKTPRSQHLNIFSFGKKFPRVSYNDLEQATGSFSKSNLIGRGNYGSVYKGKLTQAKIEVAIKVFDLEIRFADKSFVSECEALRTIRHRNLLPVLTACSTIDNSGNDFKSLIYEFMPNGNLDTWLHQRHGAAPKFLGLAQRISVGVDVADALAYLHHDCGITIVHCDLKPTNILLDDHMNAYLGDFGIANLIVDSRSVAVGHSGCSTSLTVTGTIGYIAPEYAQSVHASTCGDVYSFGIVLLEMITGKRPTDSMFEGELSIANFVERSFPDQVLHIIDPHLQEECKGSNKAIVATENKAYRCMLSLVQVALACTLRLPRERMSMREVAINLHTIRKSYAICHNK